MNTNTTAMNPAQLDAFGAEIEAVKQRALADRGERDARYIKQLVRFTTCSPLARA